jgi:dipeptidyl aminopeptidase/acylaminoacyl peptidase
MLVLMLMLMLAGSTSFAQGTRADYARSEALRGLSSGRVFKTTVKPNWLTGQDRFWYRNELADGGLEYLLVDALVGTRGSAFDAGRLSEVLSQKTGKPFDRNRLNLTNLDFAADGNSMTFELDQQAYRCDLVQYKLEETTVTPNPADAEKGTRMSRQTGEETELVLTNKTTGPVRLVWLDAEGQRRPYGTVERGATFRQHTFAGHVWLVLDRSGKEIGLFKATVKPREVELDDKSKPPVPQARDEASQNRRRRNGGSNQSPDGRYEARITEHNVVLRDLSSQEEIRLSTEGTAADFYRGPFFWSPDSTCLIAFQEQPAEEHKITIVESSPRETLQPRVKTLDYLKPGDKIAHSRPRLFNVAQKQPIPVDDTLFSNPWSLSDFQWMSDSTHFTFLYNQRGHQSLRWISLDATNGQSRVIIDERSPTFIDYSNKTFLRVLEETNEVIWMSERDGWNHLYLIDLQTGAVKNTITSGPWVVRRVDDVDPATRQIRFRALGLFPDQDPYALHFARVNFDGTGLTRLTEGDGTHDLQASPDGRFLIDTYSRVDQPPVIELRRESDGAKICELERGDWSALLSTGWRVPERFVAKGRDGTTDIHGVIWRPTNFDESRSYPVIEMIYAGPQGAFVPKSFSAYYPTQGLAELGFIVVQIDGMGTNWRSKSFHDVCWKNLADGGFPDRILWLRAAAARYPQFDLSRVGLYGGSAGGQNALAGLLHHGDFYQAAAADCGCHDNRMDKIWWNEAWMGWPIGPEYAASSNVTHAAKLQGKLLLTVGELDQNVDPASTMQVVNALIQANKDFELIVFPGGGHGSGESPYGDRRRKDFFVKHLLKVDPRSN